MATIGLKMVYTGLKASDGSVVADADKGLDATGVFAIDTDKAKGNLGTKTANITGLSGTPTKIDGNNETVDISNPPASPSVAIDSNLINYVVKEKILGRVSDSKGGYVDGDVLPECGLIVEAQSPVTLDSIFFCFGRGTFNEAGQNIQTNTSTAETRDDDNLTYAALNYSKFVDAKGNSHPFKIYHATDAAFDKKAMFDEIFPGQTYIPAGTTTGTTGD
ncbi:phage tail protein [Liquorilactobacillus mali]|uniref:phage tail protein n=1 Tax=Liquorilactobacillus mali TaxID=1618 RepID=UPI002651EBD4|nr:phage tail protein [Liquorilactobacillus mali]MDN7145266.1 phage tail protein [Liquorilactobacillus mali]